MSLEPQPLRWQCPPRRGRWQTGPHPRPPHSHSDVPTHACTRTHSHMHTHRHMRVRTQTHTSNRDAHTLPRACSLLSAPRPPWHGPSVLPVEGREPGEATSFIRQKGKWKLRKRKDPPDPCSTQSPSSAPVHTQPIRPVRLPRAPTPCPPGSPAFPREGSGFPRTVLRRSGLATAAHPHPPPHSTPPPAMELECFGPSQHLRSISGCVRRQAPHPCLRASLQPSALSVLPVAPQPLGKQPGVHWDLRARPASQLRERAQPWPQGTLFRALSFVGTPGLWHSWQETLCGECFNKSPFENGIFFSQRARALLRQPNPPPR